MVQIRTRLYRQQAECAARFRKRLSIYSAYLLVAILYCLIRRSRPFVAG